MQSIGVGRKLAIGFSFLLLQLTVLAWSGLWLASQMKDGLRNTAVVMRKIALTNDIERERAEMRTALRGEMMYTFANQPGEVETSHAGYLKSADRLEKALAELKPLLVTDEGKQLLARMETDLPQWRGKAEEAYRLCQKGQPQDAALLAKNEIRPLTDDILAASTALRDRQTKQLAEADQSTEQRASASTWLSSVFAVLGIIVAFTSFRIVRGIGGTLRELSTQLREGTRQVAEAASQTFSSSQALAQGASEQAASLEETSSSTQEIHSMTSQNAQNARTATQVMQGVSLEIENGNRKLSEMIAAISAINDSSVKVSKIIKVIDDISFQTNILALNAAVEAARAGESGMGFAVVADEVRNLAQRCAQAAKDTAGLIDESVARSSEGRRTVDEVAKAIAGITGKAEQVRTLVSEVSAASQEQEKGLDQIAQSVSQMEQVTQKAAAIAEESAASSHELTGQSQSLQQLAAALNRFVEGGADESNAMSMQLSESRIHHSVNVSVPRRPAPSHSGTTQKVRPVAPASESEEVEWIMQ